MTFDFQNLSFTYFWGRDSWSPKCSSRTLGTNFFVVDIQDIFKICVCVYKFCRQYVQYVYRKFAMCLWVIMSHDPIFGVRGDPQNTTVTPKKRLYQQMVSIFWLRALENPCTPIFIKIGQVSILVIFEEYTPKKPEFSGKKTFRPKFGCDFWNQNPRNPYIPNFIEIWQDSISVTFWGHRSFRTKLLTWFLDSEPSKTFVYQISPKSEVFQQYLYYLAQGLKHFSFQDYVVPARYRDRKCHKADVLGQGVEKKAFTRPGCYRTLVLKDLRS